MFGMFGASDSSSRRYRCCIDSINIQRSTKDSYAELSLGKRSSTMSLSNGADRLDFRTAKISWPNRNKSHLKMLGRRE